jgi:hypothetical protein
MKIMPTSESEILGTGGLEICVPTGPPGDPDGCSKVEKLCLRVRKHV